MPTQSIHTLPISSLQPNPLQPRGKVQKEELDELVQSVKQYGVLEPIIVAHTPAGYQIIAGERRWRAAKLANLSEVPVIVKETTPRGMLEMAIIENVQRVDLSPIERAQAFLQLQRDFRFTQDQIAEKVGKSLPYISNSLRLLDLPDAIKDALAGKLITEGHARALLSISDMGDMIECYKIILKENASVRRAEELARHFKEKIVQKTQSGGGRGITQVDINDQVTAQLKKVFRAKTQIKLIRSTRQTKITFIFKGSPEETETELEKILQITKE